MDRQDHRIHLAMKNTTSISACGSFPFNFRHFLMILVGMSLSGCGPTRAPSQWIIVISRTTAPYSPALFQGCDVEITDMGFTISTKILDVSTSKIAAIAEIKGTFNAPWRDPKHGVASVKIIGVGGKAAIGTGNITGVDRFGEPNELLILVRSIDADQEGKDNVITIKRFDGDH
jgi:hypothetical protein